jgi:uncharacterized protein HemX
VATYQIKDITEVDFNGAFLEVGIASRDVDELRDLALTHLRGTITENEQEGVDRVGLSRAIRADNRRE